MRKLLLATTAAIAIGAPAQAADLPVKAPPVVAAAVYSWTGFYIGGHAGGAWGRGRVTLDPTGAWAGFPAAAAIVAANGATTLHPNGIVGGGQVGFNRQINNFVWGLEADFSYFGIRASSARGPFTAPGVVDDHSLTESITGRWLATLRGRLGITAGRGLLYATGGLAVANYRLSQVITYASPTAPDSVTTTRAGWTVGGGGELAVTNNWSAKVEYLHAQFGTVSFNDALTAAPTYTHTHNLRLSTHIVRFGLNYRWGEAVVGRY